MLHWNVKKKKKKKKKGKLDCVLYILKKASLHPNTGHHSGDCYCRFAMVSKISPDFVERITIFIKS